MASVGCDEPHDAGLWCARRSRGFEAEQPPQHAIGAASQQTRKSQHLVGAQTNGIRPLAGILKRDVARHQRIGRDASLGATGHGLHQIGDGERAALPVRRHPAVAQHGAAVGQRHDLVEPVRDIDDRDALLLHAPEHREQPFDFARFQRRGRLVEDQQPAAPAQRLGDGDELALRERQAVDAKVRVRREIELRQSLARLIPHRVAVDDAIRPAGAAPADRRASDSRQSTAREPDAAPAEW